MKVEIENEIGEKLFRRVEQGDQFSTLSEYLNYILRQVVQKLEAEGSSAQSELSEEEEKRIRKRLKSLGYL